ncbi:Rhodanese-like protein [Lophium mytilinum]|uniref:Rhodanese-like protein n=1 Tax=Lophium mytilinum TaxID=390894 RepID=A0A6A6QBD6_9PEZI|nr:Rhodanese-like protein [Lophium mytilinum]
MSFYTISDIGRITRDDLSQHLLSASPPPLPPHLAIVDVRDSDHVGGHIAGSTHIPSNTLDYRLPELLRVLRDKQTVVFHCALSQQRGPSAALRYLRERRKEEEREREAKEEEGVKQQVVVLEGGFVKWQEKFGEDKRLTEAYAPDIWAYGYQG